MENTTLRYSRSFPSNSSKQRRSGYEPSDTETDWQESPLHNQNHKNGTFGLEDSTMELDLPRNISPMRQTRKLSSKTDDSSPKKETWKRQSSKPPYKARKEDGRMVLPISVRRKDSPFSKSERRRQVDSPFKPAREEHDMYNNDDTIGSSSRKSQANPARDKSSLSQFGEVSRTSERSSHSGRAATAPRQRTTEKEQENYHGYKDNKGERTPSPLVRNMINKQREREAPHTKTPSVGEINEMAANIKISRTPMFSVPNFESTESISPTISSFLMITQP